MAKKKHNKDEKLHNSDFVDDGPDFTWQERVELALEDEVQRSSEIYYYSDEDGNIRSNEFLTEELISDDSVSPRHKDLTFKRAH